ncbi:MAG: DNA repair protein RadC [Thiohalomonadales bacterium]
MSIKEWPKHEQPRYKLLQFGADTLSDAELLAIFLRTGVRGKSAVELAGDLVRDFGNLRRLLMADKNQFCKAKGLGEAKFVQLQAVLEMSKRHMALSLNRGESFTDPSRVKHYLRNQLRDEQQEVFAALLLDSQHRVIRFDRLFYGTIDQSAVYPREVVKRALQYNAAAIIFAHNHPSGHSEPSNADRQITQVLKDALNLVDVRVLDHIVVGDTDVVSFAERGYL